MFFNHKLNKTLISSFTDKKLKNQSMFEDDFEPQRGGSKQDLLDFSKKNKADNSSIL
jgi:hypothetical protein